MAGLDIFHYVPGDSFLHRADPRFKIGSFVLFGMTVAAGKGTAGFVILSLALATAFVFSRLPWRRLFQEMRVMGIFVVAIFFVYALTIPGRPLIQSVSGLSFEGSVYGLTFAWKIVLVLILGILLTGTTSPERISEAMESILRPILPARGGISGARVATMIGLSLVMVPLVLDQAADLIEAQAARNIALRKKPIYRIRCLVIPLLTKILERAEQMAEAMEARCFSELRTGAGFKPEFRDWFLLFFSVGICGIVVWV